MADQKVSDLPSLNGADVDPADLLYIIDSSAGSAGSKKITVGQYQLAPVSGGTANGVVYLNASKVATAGSDLVFDGTNLGVGTSSPGAKLEVASGKVLLSNGQSYAVKSSGGAVNDVIGLTAGNVLILGGGGATDSIQFWNQGVQRMALDSSGNLGLGATPSAWGGGFKALEMSNGSVSINANGPYINQNAIFDTAWKYKANGFAAQYSQIGGVHSWFTAPSGTAGNAISFTQAMTLDASGNLGIGISSPQAVLHVNKATTSTFRLSATNVGIDIQSLDGAGYGLVSTYTNHPMVFATSATERARITSGGALVVGNTAAAGFESLCASNNSATTAPFSSWNRATAGDNFFAGWYTEGTATIRGTIDYNRAGGLVRYNTTSDYRAKDIIGPVQNPGATIDALKVYEGRMKGASQSRPMLIAHEAQEHVPFCVSGEKDEVNEDGTPKFQQMDHASLVPLLLVEIQSLRARVAALEAA